MRFTIPDAVLAQLRTVRSRQDFKDNVIEKEDAFYLDQGFGDVLYLTADGRVLLEPLFPADAPVREANDDEAVTALVLGAKKTGVTDLLSLIPLPPPAAPVCQRCNGERWIRAGTIAETGEPLMFVCFDCSGRGYTIPR